MKKKKKPKPDNWVFVLPLRILVKPRKRRILPYLTVKVSS